MFLQLEHHCTLLLVRGHQWCQRNRRHVPRRLGRAVSGRGRQCHVPRRRDESRRGMCASGENLYSVNAVQAKSYVFMNRLLVAVRSHFSRLKRHFFVEHLHRNFAVPFSWRSKRSEIAVRAQVLRLGRYFFDKNLPCSVDTLIERLFTARARYEVIIISSL